MAADIPVLEHYYVILHQGLNLGAKFGHYQIKFFHLNNISSTSTTKHSYLPNILPQSMFNKTHENLEFYNHSFLPTASILFIIFK